jgi:hypothetical protein
MYIYIIIIYIYMYILDMYMFQHPGIQSSTVPSKIILALCQDDDRERGGRVVPP